MSVQIMTGNRFIALGCWVVRFLPHAAEIPQLKVGTMLSFAPFAGVLGFRDTHLEIGTACDSLCSLCHRTYLSSNFRISAVAPS